jgi:4-aminobutyrate aminotransferase
MPQTATPSEAKRPQLKTSLPGLEAKKIIELDDRLLSPSYTRDYPLVMRRGRGAMVEDVDGRKHGDPGGKAGRRHPR